MGDKPFDVFPPAVGTEVLGNWCLGNGYPLACAAASIWIDGQTTPPSLWQTATPHSIMYGRKAWGSPESTPQQALKPCCNAMLTCDPASISICRAGIKGCCGYVPPRGKVLFRVKGKTVCDISIMGSTLFPGWKRAISHCAESCGVSECAAESLVVTIMENTKPNKNMVKNFGLC